MLNGAYNVNFRALVNDIIFQRVPNAKPLCFWAQNQMRIPNHFKLFKSLSSNWYKYFRSTLIQPPTEVDILGFFEADVSGIPEVPVLGDI